MGHPPASAQDRPAARRKHWACGRTVTALRRARASSCARRRSGAVGRTALLQARRTGREQERTNSLVSTGLREPESVEGPWRVKPVPSAPLRGGLENTHPAAVGIREPDVARRTRGGPSHREPRADARTPVTAKAAFGPAFRRRRDRAARQPANPPRVRHEQRRLCGRAVDRQAGHPGPVVEQHACLELRMESLGSDGRPEEEPAVGHDDRPVLQDCRCGRARRVLQVRGRSVPHRQIGGPAGKHPQDSPVRRVRDVRLAGGGDRDPTRTVELQIMRSRLRHDAARQTFLAAPPRARKGCYPARRVDAPDPGPIGRVHVALTVHGEAAGPARVPPGPLLAGPRRRKAARSPIPVRAGRPAPSAAGAAPPGWSIVRLPEPSSTWECDAASRSRRPPQGLGCVPGLASHLLSLEAPGLPQDRHDRHRRRPVHLEAFCNATRFRAPAVEPPTGSMSATPEAVAGSMGATAPPCP